MDLWEMGKVFKPEDTVKGRRMIEEATKDLSPGLREAVVRVLESWRGVESERELRRLLSKEEVSILLHKIGRGQKEDSRATGSSV